MAKKKNKAPTMPSYAPVQMPSYQPIDYAAQAAATMEAQLQYADANIEKQVKAQSELNRNAFSLTEEIAPKQAQLRIGLNERYSPQITQNYMDRIDQADPYFNAVRNQLGSRVSSDLDAGYNLGADLEREVEQGIRKGQTARGNWLGPAPTAAEAFAKASASIDLNNQRQSNARGYLQSRAPSDMFGAYGATEAYSPVSLITPQSNYVDAGLPAQLASAEASNRLSYGNSLISAYGANQQAQGATYDRQWDKYLYNTSVSKGLYNPVTAGGGAGGGGAGGAMMSAGIGAAGLAGTAVLGAGATAAGTAVAAAGTTGLFATAGPAIAAGLLAL